MGPGGAAPGLRPPGAPPVAAAPGALRPFAEVIKDAKRSDATMAFWQKDDKVWLELRPEDFNQPFFLSAKLKTGIGERMFFGGMMQDSGIVEFRRVHNQVQMIWRNIGYVAKAGTPGAAAIEAGYSPSLIASAPVLSLPDPERKAVLVEANTLFLADLLGLGMDLQRSYRQGYSFDPRNSAITKARGSADLLVLEVLGHYATASIAVPQPGSPPGMPQPSAPRSLPDPRSMFLGLHYSLSRLPAEPMAGRKADPRIGYFDSGRFDFSDDLERTPRQRYVNRWRLEKSDPKAALAAQEADHLVRRGHRPARVSPLRRGGHPRVEQGVREDRLQERRRGAAAGERGLRPRGRTTTPRSAGSRRRGRDGSGRPGTR